jgi:hypothetical protein
VNGKRKPVTLVSIVVARKIAVGIRDGSDFNHPIIAIKPATMAIRLIETCNIVKVARLMPNMMMPDVLLRVIGVLAWRITVPGLLPG